MVTMIRRYKPARSFSPLGRVVHEIRLYDDGSVVYWLQPPGGSPEPHTEVRFSGGHHAVDFELEVSRGELREVPTTA